MFSFFRKLWWKFIYRELPEKLLQEDDLGVEFIRQTIFDEELDMEITIELVCTCGLPVAKAGDDGFYCLHCDRPCPHGLARCVQCGYAMLDRVNDVLDEGEED